MKNPYIEPILIGMAIGLAILLFSYCTPKKVDAQVRNHYLEVGDNYQRLADENMSALIKQAYATQAMAAYIAAIVERGN